MDSEPTKMGWSKVGTFIHCPQKYAYSYLMPKERKSSKLNRNFIRGLMIHDGLECMYREIQQGNTDIVDIMAQVSGLLHVRAHEKGMEWIEHLHTCTSTILMYINHWLGLDCAEQLSAIKVVDIEKYLSMPIGDEFILTGRCDLVIEDDRGMIYLVEHKTAEKIENKTQEYYEISGQLIGYELMAKKIWGDKFGGIYLNMIGIDDQRFKRVFIKDRKHMSKRFEPTIYDAMKRMKSLDDAQTPLNEYPMAMHELVCHHRYGACQFINKCKKGE